MGLKKVPTKSAGKNIPNKGGAHIDSEKRSLSKYEHGDFLGGARLVKNDYYSVYREPNDTSR